jgi:hypothetical protein
MVNDTLKAAVFDQLGYDSADVPKFQVWREVTELYETLEDVTKHGANAGFGSFCYYSDTCQFAEDNMKHIVELAEQQAADFGQDILEMIQHFNCLTDNDRRPLYTQSQIGRVIFGGDTESDESTDILNALAWYALEETARQETES